MNPEDAIDLGREAIRTCFFVGGPILAVGLLVGLLVGVLQAMTQVQDQTVSFVPKIILMFVALALALPWLADRMVDFTRQSLESPSIRLAGSNQTFTFGASDSETDRLPTETPAEMPAETPTQNTPEWLEPDEGTDVPGDMVTKSSMPSLRNNSDFAFSMPRMTNPKSSSMPMVTTGRPVSELTSDDESAEPEARVAENNDFGWNR